MNRFAGALWAALSAPLIYAQTPSIVCNPAAVAPLVRAEGLTEPVGEIVLSCSGPANAAVSTKLTVYVSARVTNRISDTGSTDVLLTADSGGTPASFNGTLVGDNAVLFPAVNFTLGPTGQATLRITNLRVAIGQATVTAPVPIQAYFAGGGPTTITLPGNSFLAVAVPTPGLLAAFNPAVVACSGSALPAEISFANLSETSQVFSTRATEGFDNAFRPRAPGEDTGTRIVLRYSGFPAGAHLFVPDAIAGSDAVVPTAGGDLGASPSGGQYAPGGSGSLLLARVAGADANGAGGVVLYHPGPAGSGMVSFNTVGEVALMNGAGTVTYEVMDANPAVRENAQFPTFLGAPRPADGGAVLAQETLSLGPVSAVDAASATAPIPRFVAGSPAPDCSAVGDCGLFPQLTVDSTELQYSAPSGTGNRVKYVRVRNEGNGLMSWNTTVTYQNGAGWLVLDPTSGLNNATIRVDALPQKLAPGTYQATLAIDAGPVAGKHVIPITFDVTAAAPAPAPTPAPVPAPEPAPAPPTAAVDSVIHGATFAPGPLVPGSIATIKGARLAGKDVSVTLDGLAAGLLYTAAGQINLVVPAGLASQSTAQLVVTVDGAAGSPVSVALAPANPGIFTNGILNQDGSVNGPDNPAQAGSLIQILATGLPLPEAGTITAKIHDVLVDAPDYSGSAPGLAGVQQVNLVVPEYFPAMTTEVLVCGVLTSNPGQRVCSPPAKITVRPK